jgi:hypothetical protein
MRHQLILSLFLMGDGEFGSYPSTTPLRSFAQDEGNLPLVYPQTNLILSEARKGVV